MFYYIILAHSFISLSLSMSCKFDSMFTDIFLSLTKLSKACVMIISFFWPLRIRMCTVQCSKMHLYGMPTQHILHSSLVSLRKTSPHLPDWLLLTVTDKIRHKSIIPHETIFQIRLNSKSTKEKEVKKRKSFC